ncbi:MAG TPA: alpha-ribazole phosphatase [Deltaproteobacteria bacterium]|nr:alpha-ribazole phosphatase [Deltaproteobacteria bacterium]
MTRVFLIRHGETTDEETGRVFKGVTDIPLSEKGLTRMKKAGEYLSSAKLDAVYTSALSRCITSGTFIASHHGLDVNVEPQLNEVHFGAWEGQTFEEIKRYYPDELKAWLADLENESPPNGEVLVDAQKRVVGAFEGIVDRHNGENCAIVAHAGTLRLILCHLLELRLSNMFRIGQSYGCINIVDFHKDLNPVISLINFSMYL